MYAICSSDGDSVHLIYYLYQGQLHQSSFTLGPWTKSAAVCSIGLDKSFYWGKRQFRIFSVACSVEGGDQVAGFIGDPALHSWRAACG